jgi:carbonic anhydrase
VAGVVDELLARNRRWAERTTAADPEFFRRLEAQQRPRRLWIGCSDSRVPATQITDSSRRCSCTEMSPTSSRRRSNLLAASSSRSSARVSDLIVCGHYGCGGSKRCSTGGASGGRKR